ncbi:hypothetical protein ABG768_013773, partial [Culter alburnus]
MLIGPVPTDAVDREPSSPDEIHARGLTSRLPLPLRVVMKRSQVNSRTCPRVHVKRVTRSLERSAALTYKHEI